MTRITKDGKFDKRHKNAELNQNIADTRSGLFGVLGVFIAWYQAWKSTRETSKYLDDLLQKQGIESRKPTPRKTGKYNFYYLVLLILMMWLMWSFLK